MEPDRAEALLTQQELLDFLGAAVRWEADPLQATITFEHDGEPVEFKKESVVRRLQADERLALADKPPEFFDLGESWQQIRSSIRGILDQELQNLQPDELRLRALEEEWARTLERRGIPRDRAYQLARQYARAGGEMASQPQRRQPAIGQPPVTAGQPAATTPAALPGGLRPETREVIARAQERAALGGARWLDYLRHPVWATGQAFGFVKSYITSFFRRGEKGAASMAQASVKTGAAKVAQKAAQQTVAKATKKVAKAVAVEATTGAVEAGLVLLPTGVSQVAAAAIELAKRAWQLARLLWGLLPKEIREALKKLAAGASLATFFIIQYLLAHWLATALAVGALVFGGPFGVVLAPAAFMLGLGMEGIVTSMLSTATTISAAIIPVTTELAFGALLAGASIATFSLAAILVPLLLAGLVVIAAIFPQNQDQGVKTTFRLEQTVVPTTIESYDGQEQELKYSLVVSSTSDRPVTIKTLGYKITTLGTDTPPVPITASLPVDTVTSDAPFKLDYSVVIADYRYRDSVVINTVTAVGRGEEETQDETETVSTKVVVGRPNLSQPFGYPAAGTIRSLDIEPVYCINKLNSKDVTAPIRDDRGRPIGCPAGYKEQDHCGTLLDLYGFTRYNCLKGGIDISGPPTPVYSTLDGTVVKSIFDRGNISLTCNPFTSPTGFCYPALAGAVYVESLDKKYTVAFLHLAEDGLIAQGSSVIRGQLLGKTYDGEICELRSDGKQCTSTGRHVHYQIFFDRVSNIYFADPTNVGRCRSGAFLPGTVEEGRASPALNEAITDPLASQVCE